MAVRHDRPVVMPAMGDSVTEGTILEWLKQEGDTVAADDPLVESLHRQGRRRGPVPRRPARSSRSTRGGRHDARRRRAVRDSADGGDADRATAAADRRRGGPAAAPEEPDRPRRRPIDIAIPTMGESVSEGMILEWLKQAGDAVEQDEGIVEVSTDKVDAELPVAGDRRDHRDARRGRRHRHRRPGRRAHAVGPGGRGARRARRPGRGARGDRSRARRRPSARRREGTARSRAASPPSRASTSRKVTGTGPGGRITKADVLERQAGADARSATPLKGGAATLARYMDESRQIPTATSFRTITVTTLDGRRKQLKEAGHKVSFTHLIAYAIAVAATEEMPVMARHFLEEDGKPHFDRRRGRQPRHRRRRQEQEGRAHADGPGDPRRRPPEPSRSFLDAFGDLIARARENKLTADDLVGANISLTNPGGIGTIASVPRLMTGQGTIVATGSIAYPVGLGNIGRVIGAEKVMTMTSTYDHRIIQGAESGQFLQVVEDYLQGEHELLREGLRRPRRAARRRPAAARRPPPPPRPPRRRPPSGPAPDEELLQAVQAATSLIKAHRTHGHLAARLDPLGSEPEGDPALDPEPLGLTPELMAPDPGARILRVGVPGATLADALPHLRETYCGTIAYEIEHIASHRQRVWLRKAIESGEYRQAADHRGEEGAARPADAGRHARALHAQGLPGPEAVLDRGPRHDGPDARRADPARASTRARARSSSAWRTAAGSTCSPTTSAAPTRRSSASSRARPRTSRPYHDPAGRHRRRQVPPRRPGHLPGRRRLAARAPGVQPVAPRVRRARRRRRHARGADQRARARTRTSTTPRRCRSSCTATPPSPARASWRRRSTSRASTATRSAARST